MEKQYKLLYSVNDHPSWGNWILFGCQQMMLVLSGILVVPFLVSSTICPGADIIDMRVKLIAGTFVSSGIATIVQTTFGLRLPVLHGPSFAFIPTLIAFANLPENKCNADVNTVVPEEEYIDKLLTIQGSLFVAVLVMPFIACTGLVGVFSKFVGPVTTCPLMIMLCMGSVPTAAEKMSLHWISIVQFCILASFAIFLENVLVPIPYFSIARRKFKFARVRVFGSFPYLIGVGCAWLICGILTWTNLEPERGEARVDKNETLIVLAHSPWFQVPIPLRFGFPRFSIGLFFGFVASTFACIVESVGDYGILAKVAMQRHPPQSSVNRAMMAEGFGSLLSAVMGVGTAVTTYAEAIALVPVTKVACRATMQLAGTLLIILGLFTKVAALLASIPDAVVGGVLAMGMAMIAGVALSNLQNVDLRLSRNLTIMGTAILVGSVVPKHFQDNPINSGNATVDSIFNMLFGIQMLIGGLVAFILDNTVPGATKEQRGIKTGDSMAADDFSIDDDGYSFSSPVNKFILRFPSLCKLPFIPPKRKIESVEDLRNGSFSSKRYLPRGGKLEVETSSTDKGRSWKLKISSIRGREKQSADRLEIHPSKIMRFTITVAAFFGLLAVSSAELIRAKRQGGCGCAQPVQANCACQSAQSCQCQMPTQSQSCGCAPQYQQQQCMPQCQQQCAQQCQPQQQQCQPQCQSTCQSACGGQQGGYIDQQFQQQMYNQPGPIPAYSSTMQPQFDQPYQQQPFQQQPFQQQPMMQGCNQCQNTCQQSCAPQMQPQMCQQSCQQQCQPQCQPQPAQQCNSCQSSCQQSCAPQMQPQMCQQSCQQQCQPQCQPQPAQQCNSCQSSCQQSCAPQMQPQTCQQSCQQQCAPSCSQSNQQQTIISITVPVAQSSPQCQSACTNTCNNQCQMQQQPRMQCQQACAQTCQNSCMPATVSCQQSTGSSCGCPRNYNQCGGQCCRK